MNNDTQKPGSSAPMLVPGGAELWASIVPTDNEDRATATHWAVFINTVYEQQRHCLSACRLTTVAAGPAALAEVDSLLENRNLMRLRDWELGTGTGYVVPVAFDVIPLELELEELHSEGAGSW